MTISEIRRMYGAAKPEEILNAYSEADIEETDAHNSDDSLLHLACSMADADAVALLLARGMSANTRNRYELTPLHALASLDDRYKAFPPESARRCADLLFDAGAAVIRRDADTGNTPITLAAKKGRFELLESAVAHGVKLTVADKDGNNALHAACEYVRHELSGLEYARSDEEKANTGRRIDQFYKSVRALLDGGMDPDDKNDRNQSALDIAIESKANNIAVLLKGGNPENADDADTKTAGMTLIQAVIAKNADSARANAELGADLNAVADDGEFAGLTPLAIACLTLELPLVELLLELGADPNFRDAAGRTAIAGWFVHLGDFHFGLQKALGKIPAKILSALIAAGMDKNGRINDKSDTALLGACSRADTGSGYNDVRMCAAVAKALIAAKCDPNLSNIDGVTPLMLLCEKDDGPIAGLVADLLDAGADLNAADKNGNTALHYAARNTAANAAKEYAELLFDYGFEKADAVNNDGKSALELASENNNEPLVKLILTNS